MNSMCFLNSERVKVAGPLSHLNIPRTIVNLLDRDLWLSYDWVDSTVRYDKCMTPPHVTQTAAGCLDVSSMPPQSDFHLFVVPEPVYLALCSSRKDIVRVGDKMLHITSTGVEMPADLLVC